MSQSTRKNLDCRFSTANENMQVTNNREFVGKMSVNSWKAGAARTIQNVKASFDSIAQRLRKPNRQTVRHYKMEARTQQTPSSYKRTPVKLYTPFGFENDTPRRSARRSGRAKRRSPLKPITPARNHAFHSPTGKLKEDVEATEKTNQQIKQMADLIEARKSKMAD